VTETDGLIKFNLDWEVAPPLQVEILDDLCRWRTTLFEMGLVGCASDGIGFGNLSERNAAAGEFIITGTQTGHFSTLEPKHFASVVEFDVDSNWIKAFGPVKPSSEALTHAACYEANSAINAVVHIHNLKLWNQVLSTNVCTSADAEYGSSELAVELRAMLREVSASEGFVLAIAGHHEGVLAVGSSLKCAYEALLRTMGLLRELGDS